MKSKPFFTPRNCTKDSPLSERDIMFLSQISKGNIYQKVGNFKRIRPLENRGLVTIDHNGKVSLTDEGSKLTSKLSV